jgi:RNA polymerase primary sigma factor
VTQDSDTENIEVIPDESVAMPDDSAHYSKLAEKVDSVLNTLTAREKRVIQKRFGFEGGQVQTLSEIGKAFDVTRERIRQIETKALRKLKHPTRLKALGASASDLNEN